MNLLKLYTIFGVFFVSVLGTLSHFFYEWTGCNPITGLFSPVNESTWEHIKLLFFPMLFYSIFMNSRLKAVYPGVTASLLSGILLGSALIPVIFYTYSGILGRHTLALDIATFLASVMISFYAVYKLALSGNAAPCALPLKIFVLIFTAAFFVFTYLPPDIGLFHNPAG